MSEENKEYGSKSIKFLKDLEGVRMRPAMYIGDTAERGFHHLLWEIVDNSIDEALAGHCDTVTVTLNSDGSATVSDNGRGIPVEMHEEEGMPAVELVMSKLHAGGKFDNDAYAVSGGLHGVGISVVNALSESTEVNIYKDGTEHVIYFSRGVKTADLKTVGSTTEKGTRVRFMPDKEIFSHSEFDWEIVCNRLREMSYLMGTTGLKIIIKEESTGRHEEFHYPEGLVAYIRDISKGKEEITDIIHFNKEVQHEKGKYGVEIAMRYTNDWHEGIYSFANNIRTGEGGTHLTGFRTALTRTFNNFVKNNNLVKKGDPPSGDDYRSGLYAIVSIKIPDPQFEGQTKGKLGSREATAIVDSVVSECLGSYLEENPEPGRAVIRKALLARDARDAARKQRDLVRRKGVLSSGSLPGKLADCQSKDTSMTELYIVEGDSAGGSAKTGRDRRYQAILPLKGKILNVEKNNANRILANQELQTMIQAIGAGVGEDFDHEKCRYGKIIIMTDADVDGSHIRTLILTFFFRQMKAMIEAGQVYVACPPLYRINKKGSKSYEYVHDDDHLRDLIKDQSVNDSVLTFANGAKFSGDELEPILISLQQLAQCTYSLKGGSRGITAEEYLAQANDNGELPLSMIQHVDSGVKTYYYNMAEYDAAKQEFNNIWNSQNPEIARDQADYLAFYYHEKQSTQRGLADLINAGVSFTTVTDDSNSSPLFSLENKGEVSSFNKLIDVVASFRDIGMKGIEVQRYKGLGEMNPDQLWESTMDPELRHMKRVVLEDALEADRTFTMLMGDETAPRREYIAAHAHEVGDLDV
ncbi:MAG: DNA gyrase subunit B [Planctomycetota bacterium]|nr:DNA gyrase subunit B [Planctomycetota bacterium]